ncbi:MAG: hypothetical protein ACKOQX_05665, partial [Actinomycetota bacterium]
KLIPAGTGMDRYNLFDVSAPDYVPMPYYSSDDESDPAAYLAGLQGNYVADEQLGEQTGEQIGDYSSDPSVDLASTTDVAVSAESEVSLDASPDTDIAQYFVSEFDQFADDYERRMQETLAVTFTSEEYQARYKSGLIKRNLARNRKIESILD